MKFGITLLLFLLTGAHAQTTSPARAVELGKKVSTDPGFIQGNYSLEQRAFRQQVQGEVVSLIKGFARDTRLPVVLHPGYNPLHYRGGFIPSGGFTYPGLENKPVVLSLELGRIKSLAPAGRSQIAPMFRLDIEPSALKFLNVFKKRKR